MKYLIVGLGFGIYDTQHVQKTSHVLENKDANNAVKHINLINYASNMTFPKVLFVNFYL